MFTTTYLILSVQLIKSNLAFKVYTYRRDSKYKIPQFIRCESY